MKHLRFAGAFRKDLKSITRRGYRLDDLDTIVTAIRRGKRLAPSARAHPLKGEWRGYWECHVASDWLLIYKVTDDEALLARTGTIPTHATLPNLQNLVPSTQRPRLYDPGMPPSGHKVSDERLEEFRRIYKEAYGEEITKAEAAEMAHRLLALYRLIMRPLPSGTSSPAPSQQPPVQIAPEAS